MGWTFQRKNRNQLLRDFFEKEFNQDNPETFKGTVIDFSQYGSEVYIAYERIHYKTNERSVYAIVCITRHHPYENENFGYKDMDECSEPFYYHCPKRILQKLTPTPYAGGVEWRKKCWEQYKDQSGMVL